MNEIKKKRLDQLFGRVKAMLAGSPPRTKIEEAAMELIEDADLDKLIELKAALEHSPAARKMAKEFLVERGIPKKEIARYI